MARKKKTPAVRETAEKYHPREVLKKPARRLTRDEFRTLATTLIAENQEALDILKDA